MNKVNIILGLTLVISLFSCTKDQEMIDSSGPSVNIVLPLSTDTFMSGDTVHIHALISDNDELHEINGILNRTHNGLTEEVWTYAEHSHSSSYEVHGVYIVQVPGIHNDFQLEISASDHNLNEGAASVSFHVHM